MDRIEIVQNIIKCKWTLFVLDRISGGMKQPGELLRSLEGLTKKVLYQRLKKLERFDVIERKVISEKPLKVFYMLTPFGKKLSRVLKAIKSL